MTFPENLDYDYGYFLPNCTYRYDYDLENPLLSKISLLIDGPFTFLAAILSLIGAHYSIKFLRSTGLNKNFTAALYSLAICDALLVLTVVFYHSIEATTILFFNTNVMWDKQKTVLITYGSVSVATTASTCLVVIITIQRFVVVWWPLSFNNYGERNLQSEMPFRQYTNLCKFKNNENSLGKILSSATFFQRAKNRRFTKDEFRPYAVPLFVVACSLILNAPVFFEFEVVPCMSWLHLTMTNHLAPTKMRLSQSYNFLRTVFMMATQTIGPVFIISVITCLTEYKLYTSLQARRRLLESQNRQKTAILLEELKEKVSRAVAIFIAVKFLLLRSLPTFFDLYETLHGIESFGTGMSILVRISDFGVVLNSATNSLAYFGRRQWLEDRLKERILKKHIRCDKNSNSVICHPKNTLIYENEEISNI